MATEAQMEELIEAVQNISLETSNVTEMCTEDYNMVASIWEVLSEISNTLKKMEAKMK